MFSKLSIFGSKAVSRYSRLLSLPSPPLICNRKRLFAIMAATKRKRASVQGESAGTNGDMLPPPVKRRQSARNSTTAATVNPDVSGEVLDAPDATRASPDSDVNDDVLPGNVKQEDGDESPLSDAPSAPEVPVTNGNNRKSAAAKKVKEAEKKVAAVVDAAEANTAAPQKGRGKAKVKQESHDVESAPAAKGKPAPKKKNDDEAFDPEAESEGEVDEAEVQAASLRPPPVNSSYLPLPWKGRIGYACLNTYLRNSNPPVFSSRTCRIQSILEHRHPLKDPSQPEHPTKNRPDKDKPADVELGHRYVEALCLANIKDIIKMCRWNEKYGIRFMRLSSEMFPFASHPEYGYDLAPFASDALAEAGKVIAELGHRVTTHPGQFTQLGSPRQQVIDNAFRDLNYHDEMLSLLKLPEQANKDAIMILHMGGVFEGKAETLNRFRENYPKLSQSVKNRLVLENDDVSWTVHDLLPVCEELNIPMVLDYHHHNILFDADKIREGTYDIQQMWPRILATWERKGIKPKCHYSEQTPAAITPRQRRKHSPRVMTLPPCPPDMDIMIEAKDKEQAVFELMRTFKLPGHEKIGDIVPYTRLDDNKVALAELAKKSRKTKKKDADEDEEDSKVELIPDEEVGMGGPEGRVYWPTGMEEWLRPKKREVKKKEPAPEKSVAQKKKEAADAYAELEATKAKANGNTNGVKAEEDSASDVDATPATKKAKAAMKKKAKSDAEKAAASAEKAASKKQPTAKGKKKTPAKAATVKAEEEEEASMSDLSDEEQEDEQVVTPARKIGGGRAAKSKQVTYAEDEDVEME